jgi:hypothetical protein
MDDALLVSIEHLFSRQRDEEAKERVQKLAMPVVLKWERASAIFRDGIARINLWETIISLAYPTTYERLKRSLGRRANAAALVSQIREEADVANNKNVWRSLLVLILESDRIERGVWHVGPGWQTSAHMADEFGIDQIHFLQPAAFRIKAVQFQREDMHASVLDVVSPALVSLGMHKEVIMHPVKIWTVPFQQAAVVQLRNVKTAKLDVVWIPNRIDRDHELSNWAINHNTMQENPQDFRSPPFLHGTDDDPPLVACTEGRSDVANAKTALSAITVRGRDLLFFDQLKQNDKKKKHWRQLLTDEVAEPRRIPVTSTCVVLDAFLLYASQDGALRAHPRGNPKSTYHVEELHSLVPHMTSLYNVVALIHSYSVLEVRRVERYEDDPFLRFNLLFADQAADVAHPPLLYGPYVIYRALDGTWYRALYDTQRRPVVREEIKVPFKAGWTIVSIKNANWRYWTIVLKSPRTTNIVEEHLLFAGGLHGGDGSPKPFLIAQCIQCGTKATGLCSSCLNVGFCKEHGETHDHLETCGQTLH